VEQDKELQEKADLKREEETKERREKYKDMNL
jgi:hypothetical protein